MSTHALSAGGSVPESMRPGERDVVSPIAAELREIVNRRWRGYYPECEGDPEITLTPRHFGFSIIFQVDLRFPVAGTSKRFMIKIRRQQKHGSFVREDLSDQTIALSRAEYAEHLKAYAFFERDRDGLSVVRPLDFVESHNAFVVEHAAGHDLSKLVRDKSPFVPGALRRCGLWWRTFHHDLHAASERAWDPQVIDAMLERRFTKLHKIGAPASSLFPLREEITAVARRVDPARVPVSLVHGDCKLRHVWASADGIQVLDFGNAKPGDSWIDPAALVVELSLYSLWTRRLDSSAKVPDIGTLLNAYFGGPPPAAFSLYVVDCLLKKWHRRLRKWGPGAGITRVHSSLKTARLDKSLERLYIDRWFSGQIRAWLAFAEGKPPKWLVPVMERPWR